MAHLKGAGYTNSGTFFGTPCSSCMVWIDVGTHGFSQRKNWQNFKHEIILYIYGNEAYKVKV